MHKCEYQIKNRKSKQLLLCGLTAKYEVNGTHCCKRHHGVLSRRPGGNQCGFLPEQALLAKPAQPAIDILSTQTHNGFVSLAQPVLPKEPINEFISSVLPEGEQTPFVLEPESEIVLDSVSDDESLDTLSQDEESVSQEESVEKSMPNIQQPKPISCATLGQATTSVNSTTAAQRIALQELSAMPSTPPDSPKQKRKKKVKKEQPKPIMGQSDDNQSLPPTQTHNGFVSGQDVAPNTNKVKSAFNSQRDILMLGAFTLMQVSESVVCSCGYDISGTVQELQGYDEAKAALNEILEDLMPEDSMDDEVDPYTKLLCIAGFVAMKRYNQNLLSKFNHANEVNPQFSPMYAD
ncbi:MAG TPA: hypothetical protein PLS50_04555 [Candidatus Dojkabacteria bacterium]|nr:hypothetical protein [Candidatus Dojkabacteria bacterium]